MILQIELLKAFEVENSSVTNFGAYEKIEKISFWCANFSHSAREVIK
jgi:hypothetical protein